MKLIPNADDEARAKALALKFGDVIEEGEQSYIIEQAAMLLMTMGLRMSPPEDRLEHPSPPWRRVADREARYLVQPIPRRAHGTRRTNGWRCSPRPSPKRRTPLRSGWRAY
jgi:hypothetical protein